MDLGIAGRRALVVASSKGLGRAIATQLAREGCRVAINGRDPASLGATASSVRAETGAEVLESPGDVSDPTDLARVTDRVIEGWGGVDILVTNSGGPSPGTFATTDDPMWATGVECTLMNVVRLVRACLPGMTERGWGRVVNVTSVSAKEPIANLLLSNSLRAAIHGLSKTLATEVAPRGVLVNCVCPGLHGTGRLQELAEVRAERDGTSAAIELEKMAASIPVGRLGDPGDLANVVAFLCSERAAFVTGTSILVDGGATACVT